LKLNSIIRGELEVNSILADLF